jgi:arsenate reductase
MMKTDALMVLFLSTGNAARSILAEALLRHKGGARFTARSAGYRCLPQVFPQTLAILSGAGIPTDGLHPKGWGEFLASAHFLKPDVIVTLSEEARAYCPTWPDAPVRVHWGVDVPLSAAAPDVQEWKFRKCFATLESRINELIKMRPAQNTAELLLQLKNIATVV